MQEISMQARLSDVIIISVRQACDRLQGAPAQCDQRSGHPGNVGRRVR